MSDLNPDTTDPTPGPLQLTAEDCAAIRGATTYVVRLEGQTVRLHLTRKERTPNRRDGYGRTDVVRERTIGGAAGSLVRGCFVQVYPSGAWKALALVVRPGDVLRFYASEDNSNNYTRAAVIPAGTLDHDRHGYDRLYVDECCVDVVRKGRQLIERLVLCYGICPQNGARPVEPSRGGKRYAEVA